MNQLFSVLEPSENLKNSIISRIKVEERKRAIYKVAYSSALTLASIFMSVFYMINIIKDSSQSGLSEYFSLLFSDGALIASYWQTYVLSVVESLPIIPITVVVASIGIFVWSINTFLSNIKNTRSVFYKINY